MLVLRERGGIGLVLAGAVSNWDTLLAAAMARRRDAMPGALGGI